MTTNDVHRFDHRTEAEQWMLEFARRGSRNLDLFTHHLTPELYCADELVSAVSALARASASSKVRILVRDSKPLCGVDHGLVNLARRLPSHISIRTLIEDTAPANIAFFCIDEADLVFFNDEFSLQGFAREQARAESRHFLETFNHMWLNQSKTDANLRLLSI